MTNFTPAVGVNMYIVPNTEAKDRLSQKQSSDKSSMTTASKGSITEEGDL
jgi:hypothetical protein